MFSYFRVCWFVESVCPLDVSSLKVRREERRRWQLVSLSLRAQTAVAEYFFCTRDFYRINDKKLASGVPLGPFLRRRSLLLRVPGDAGMAGVYG